MKLITLITGEEVRGEIVEQTTQSLTVNIPMGQLVLDKSKVASAVEILDCTLVKVGEFISTPRGVYLKIDEGTFRLVKGPYTSQIDVDSIQVGEVVPISTVFPPEEEIFAEPEQ